MDKNFYDVKIARLPVKNRRFTVLKSPHVNKTAREQFELREHKCIITLNINESLKNHDRFLNFLFQ
jgi:ribosomal protein S10